MFIMNTSANSGLRLLLLRVARLLFVAAGLTFLYCGRVIYAIAGTARMKAEMEGIGVAIVFGALGAWAKSSADELKDSEITTSLDSGMDSHQE
jgi:uncharacterized membrane protein YqjE